VTLKFQKLTSLCLEQINSPAYTNSKRKLEKVKLFNDFTILTGGFGTVNICIHKDLQERRAVKILSKKNMSNSVKNAIRNEYEILANMDHPHIVKLFEIFEDKNYFYLV
jgi:calcium-dependent protein kinase